MIMHTMLLLFTLLLGLTSAAPTTNFTISTPSDPVGSRRRGIPYNNPSFVQLFDVTDNQVGWCYNWAPVTDETHTPFEYVPMLWSDRDNGDWWKAVLRASNFLKDMPTHLLGFNEPDNCQPGAGGSCISVSSAVAAWKEHMQPAKQLKEKMYLGSPAVTNGVNGMGLDWLKDFMNQCDGCSIDFICLHWYDSARNPAYFKSHITAARALAQGRPIWITEFYPQGTDDEIKSFLAEIIPWMDASTDIHRYAMFMAREGMLLNNGGNGLSEVGKAFVAGNLPKSAAKRESDGSVKKMVARGICSLFCQYRGWCPGWCEGGSAEATGVESVNTLAAGQALASGNLPKNARREVKQGDGGVKKMVARGICSLFCQYRGFCPSKCEGGSASAMDVESVNTPATEVAA